MEENNDSDFAPCGVLALDDASFDRLLQVLDRPGGFQWVGSLSSES